MVEPPFLETEHSGHDIGILEFKACTTDAHLNSVIVRAFFVDTMMSRNGI